MQAKSDENWSVGNQCLNDGNYNVAASRLYYAVFQAVLHYARTKSKFEYKGQACHNEMTQIVKNHGRQRLYYVEIFKDLMNLRVIADYELETPDSTELKDLLVDSDKIRSFFFNEANQ